MPVYERSRDAFSLGDGPVGCLLLHGFGGSPAEMGPMGRSLANAGYFVSCPVLAGHDDLSSMSVTTWKDWLASAQDALSQLKAKKSRVYIIGFSLGGLLAYDLASSNEVAGVVSVNAPVRLVSRQVLRAQLLKLCRREDERLPMACLSNLYDYSSRVSGLLSDVKAPALVIQARQDEAIDPGDGKVILEHLASPDKQICWIDGGTHLVVLENHREQVFASIEGFLKQHSEAPSSEDEQE